MDQHNEKSPLPLGDGSGPTGEKNVSQEPAQVQHQYGYSTPNQQELPPNQQLMSVYPYPPPTEGRQQDERAMLGSWQQQQQQCYGTSAGANSNSVWPPRPTATAPPPVGSEEPCWQWQLVYPQKSLGDTYLLAVVFGLLGVHHFYLKRYSWGFVYLFTFGLFGFGYIIDLFRIPYLVKKYNEEHSSAVALLYSDKKKDLSDAYVAWFPCGLLGFHHYYLGNLGWGVVYTFTFGIFGIGWIVDGFRMPSLLRQANERIQREGGFLERERKMLVCYALGIPFGILGLHNFYLKRPLFGVFYFFTFGLFGIGWFVDLFRMPILRRRCNDEIRGTRDGQVKTLDDCYVVWLTFGLIGSHHFYLQRPLWGIMYFFTFGLFGIGWLVDLFRIPSLVKDTNMKMKREGNMPEFQANPSQPIIAGNQNEPQYHNSGNFVPHPYFSTPPPIAGPPSYEESTDSAKPPPYQE